MDSSSIYKGLLFGGVASCVAECITIPVDVVKTRMQLRSKLILRGSHSALEQYPNSIRAGWTIAQTEGVRALWKGLTPALLRQSTYGSMRYGFYTPIKKMLGGGGEGEKKSDGGGGLWKKVVSASLAGALSSSIANPTDLIKVRLQASGMPGTDSRNYKGLFDAFSQIISKEGFFGLWKGVGATTGRATVLSAVELASYDEIKSKFSSSNVLRPGLPLHVGSSLCAGFLASFASSPFDVIKSRVMQQPVDERGKGLYFKGMTDCFVKSIRSEGIISLWKGFWPNYARVGPRVLIVFVVMERLKMWFD